MSTPNPDQLKEDHRLSQIYVALLECQGWTEGIVPWLSKQVATVEAKILSGELTHEQYLFGCAERKTLQNLINKPQLALSVSRAALAKANTQKPNPTT